VWSFCFFPFTFFLFPFYFPSVRRLIVNADDFGLTAGVNRAIAEAHQRGIVTSSTLMATGGACDDAIRLARETPALAVGCHVVLADGEPLSGAQQVPSLVAERCRRGFRDGFAAFALAALRGRIRPDDIEREATAQIRKLQSAGVQLTHLDTHKHLHMLPQVLAPLLSAARACGVAAVRNPFAPVQPLAFAHLARRPRLWRRYSEVRALRGWHTKFRGAVAAAGMATTDGSLGVLGTGALDLPLLEAILGCMPKGTWEFVCHPGYNDADLDRVRTRLRQSRPQELAVLTSDRARELIAERGIQLISYRELMKT